jgi:hypothetical protein
MINVFGRKHKTLTKAITKLVIKVVAYLRPYRIGIPVKVPHILVVEHVCLSILSHNCETE